MGADLHVFTRYSIDRHTYNLNEEDEYTEYEVGFRGEHYEDSFSYGNRSTLMDVFRNNLGVDIPFIDDMIQDEHYEIKGLIEPRRMFELCTELLENKVYDLKGTEERIKRIQMFSNLGFYIAFDRY